uniref:TSA: Wollemia nobilis Ref_Wollemi_Transcript_499_1826 transcribed RNA sequence n=1 Tax=Wollemia nobilis TaxID=56998 RepID=A0A0C9SB63_9CONI
MASGWDESGSYVIGNSSPGGGAEGDGSLLETLQGSAPGSLQNDGLLGDASGHNSDAEHGFSRPEMFSKPLVGSVQLYDRHVFLCYKNPESWPPQVEAAEFDRLPRLLAAALKARKNEIPRKTRLTICEGRDGTETSNGDVLIFPDMIRYKGLTHFDVDTFVEEVLVKDTEWLSGNPEILTGSHIFVCAHASRDRRCGVCGPALIRRFKEEIESRGLRSQVSVSPCSHIGGHKYAGNIIIYGPNADAKITGHWYGYVTPDDVPILLDQHIGKGEIVDRLWRGQMGLTGDEQEKAQQERLTPNGESFLERGDNEVGLENGEKVTGLSSEIIDPMSGIQNEVAGCCQGGSANCCQSFTPEENVQSDELDTKPSRASTEDSKERRHGSFACKGWGGVSKWFDTWEREDTYAALAVIGAVASVAVAYNFYRRSG